MLKAAIEKIQEMSKPMIQCFCHLCGIHRRGPSHLGPTQHAEPEQPGCPGENG